MNKNAETSEPWFWAIDCPGCGMTCESEHEYRLHECQEDSDGTLRSAWAFDTEDDQLPSFLTPAPKVVFEGPIKDFPAWWATQQASQNPSEFDGGEA